MRLLVLIFVTRLVLAAVPASGEQEPSAVRPSITTRMLKARKERLPDHPRRAMLGVPPESLVKARRRFTGADSVSLDWRSRSLLSQSLLDSALRTVERASIRGPQASISTERIRLLKLAITQLDTAEVEAEALPEKAVIRVQHGHILEVVGFPLDAHGWYGAALRADSTNVAARIGLWRVARGLLGRP